MKVLLLSDTNSEHTEKWALGLADAGITIGLFSFNKAPYAWYNHANITVFYEPEGSINAESTLTKLSYLKYVGILKKIIRHFKPDILHAHYATSYGMVGALSRFRPFVLSVWGSDVYDFPTRTRLHKKLFQHNLRKADLIMSTSHIMRDETARYTGKEIVVTPFGVDTEKFSKRTITKKDPSCIYIGTIKPIEEKYGIEYIIEAAELILRQASNQKFKFLLIGQGDVEHYRSLIIKKGLGDNFELTGRIPFSKISDYHNLLDIFLNVSIYDSESFGVATVEAMACEKPVIVTDVGGLMEVVGQGKFGVVVPRRDAAAIASKVLDLIADRKAAELLGAEARQHVLKNYDWKENLQKMISSYTNLLKERSELKGN